MYPDFIEKLLWGGKVIGLRVALSSARPSVVKSLVSKACETRARKDAGASHPDVHEQCSRVAAARSKRLS